MSNVHGSGILATGTNILINGWLKDPINQRAATTCTTPGYFVDRWRADFYSGDAIAVVNNGVKIVSGSNASAPCLVQPIENPARFAGKTVTVSAITNAVGGSGDISKGYISIIANDTELVFVTIQRPGLVFVTATIPNDITKLSVKIAAYWNNYVVYEAAKLEPGPISTLMYDAPPDMAMEEARCKRYFERLGNAQSGKLTNWTYIPQGSAQAIFSIAYSAKRVDPTIALSAPGQYRVLLRESATGRIFGASAVSALSVNETSKTTATVTVAISPTDRPAHGILQREDGATSAWINIDAEIY